MELFDIVKSVDGPLHSGCQAYGAAVVASVDPFVLCSEHGDMIWRNVKPADFYVVGFLDESARWRITARMDLEAIHAANIDITNGIPSEEFVRNLRGGLMDATQALEILKKYRAWKADPTAIGMPDPELLGQAIDAAANASPKCWPHEGVLIRYNAWRRDSTGHEVCPSKFSIMAAIEHAIEKWSTK